LRARFRVKNASADDHIAKIFENFFDAFFSTSRVAFRVSRRSRAAGAKASQSTGASEAQRKKAYFSR
jgi:hypothetical protein